MKAQSEHDLKAYISRTYANASKTVPSPVQVYDYTLSTASSTGSSAIYREGNTIDLRNLGTGGRDIELIEASKLRVGNDLYDVKRTTEGVIYQTQYSIVGGLQLNGQTITDAKKNQNGILRTSEVPNFYSSYEMLLKGSPTQKMPVEGSAVYNGHGFNHGGRGSWNLNYKVDFAEKSGQGTLTAGVPNTAGADIVATVTLAKSHFGNSASTIHVNRLDGSTISGFGISGGASSSIKGIPKDDLKMPVAPAAPAPDADAATIQAYNKEVNQYNADLAEARGKIAEQDRLYGFFDKGSYDLVFFGPNAEEISGLVRLDNRAIAFSGAKNDPSTESNSSTDNSTANK